MRHTNWKDELKEEFERRADEALDATNVAAATNVGKKGNHTTVSSRQRVVQRNGKTVRVEERVERRDG